MGLCSLVKVFTDFTTCIKAQWPFFGEPWTNLPYKFKEILQNPWVHFDIFLTNCLFQKLYIHFSAFKIYLAHFYLPNLHPFLSTISPRGVGELVTPRVKPVPNRMYPVYLPILVSVPVLGATNQRLVKLKELVLQEEVSGRIKYKWLKVKWWVQGGQRMLCGKQLSSLLSLISAFFLSDLPHTLPFSQNSSPTWGWALAAYLWSPDSTDTISQLLYSILGIIAKGRSRMIERDRGEKFALRLCLL